VAEPEFVTLQVDDGVGTIRLDRPKMNAIDEQLHMEVRAAALEAGERADVRAVVLYGGERVFAAGADIKAMSRLDGRSMVAWGRELTDSFTAVQEIPKPVIAAITGYALGGGYELALCADFRVMGAGAKVGQPEILLGVIPGAGGTQRLARLIGPAKAKDLVFTGRHVGAEEALEIGLADAVVPDAEVYDTSVAMARKFAAGPPLALAAAKKAIDEGLDRPLREGLALESRLFAELFDTEDQRTGMRSFLESGPAPPPPRRDGRYPAVTSTIGAGGRWPAPLMRGGGLTMDIVVLVKQVPDSGSERNLDPADNTVARGSADNVVNEIDEYAIEEALQLKEAHGGEVTLLTVGPDSAADAIRKALSMGADRAVHVVDDAIHGACAPQTSAILAAALQQMSFDIVLCGAESTDGQLSVMPALLAERLGIPQLSGARKLTVEGGVARVERQTDGGYWALEAPLPAIVSTWDTINEPRYPSFKGIMAAKKKPVEKKSLADLGIDPSTVGLATATSQVLDFAGRPPKGAGVKVTDEGDGAAKLVDFLATQKIV
jgi:electron transfer flavoprotein beta subunit